MNSIFKENLAGIGGAALNLHNIQHSSIFIGNSSFTKHTGAYSIFEKDLLTPFYDVLTMRNWYLNFFQFTKKIPQLLKYELDQSHGFFHDRVFYIMHTSTANDTYVDVEDNEKSVPTLIMNPLNPLSTS